MRRTTGCAFGLRRLGGARVCSATLLQTNGGYLGHHATAGRLGGRAGMATTADDLLKLFKQAVSNKGAGTDQTSSAGASRSSSPSSSPRSGRTSSVAPGHWAKKLADQLGEERVRPTAGAEAPETQPTSRRTRKEALFGPVGISEENMTPAPRREGRGQRRVRASEAVTEMDYDDDDDEVMRSRAMRMALQESVQPLSFSEEESQDGFQLDEDGGWESMAAEINAWAKKLENALRPHSEVINKHRKTRRMRREKYRAFIARCMAFRQAKKTKNGSQNKVQPWEWPKERDLLYNTDLYVPLNLQLKGIPEEGEDLAALLDKTMKDAALVMGHNASWPLEEKRKLMLGLKAFFEKTVRDPLPQYDIFVDQRNVMNDDFLTGGSSGDQ